MATPESDDVAALQWAMGQPAPPDRITQHAFDYDAAHLRRLVSLQPGERAEPGDLWDYAQDLRYTEIQSPLVAYLLPVCLQAWRDDLRGTDRSYGGFVEQFYPVLADRHLFDEHLTPEQTAAVSAFMRGAILAEMDDQRGLEYHGMHARPYRWVRALTTYGVLLPDIERLWTRWWALETIGHAVSFVQYASTLMYRDHENPVFARWTQDEGGGPPCLWEFAGDLYEHRWLESNVELLKRALTPAAIAEGTRRAVTRLVNEPERAIASRLEADLPRRTEMLESRCARLPQLLATTQQAGTLLDWDG